MRHTIDLDLETFKIVLEFWSQVKAAYRLIDTDQNCSDHRAQYEHTKNSYHSFFIHTYILRKVPRVSARNYYKSNEKEVNLSHYLENVVGGDGDHEQDEEDEGERV